MDESYAYFSLLKMPHSSNEQEFKRHYLQDGNKVLHTALQHIMIRRTWQTKFFGRASAYVPPTSSSDIPVTPKPMEKHFCQLIWKKNAKKIRSIQANKNIPPADKKAKVMALLSRIMQMTIHWCLVLEFIGQRSHEDIENLLREFCSEASNVDLASARNYIIDISEKYEQELTKFKNEEATLQAKNQARKLQYEKASMPIPAKLKQLPRPKKNQFSIHSWSKAGHPLIHSSKTEAVVREIMTRLQKDPLRKFVVFTQSRPIIEILSRWLTREQIEHVTYHGSMKTKDREVAIKIFTEQETSVIIMSLFAGGEGLDLKCATCVINIDLWWNRSKEEQAHMRIIRIGQEKETETIRIILKDTFDQHIIKRQNEKQAKIEGAMLAANENHKGWTLDDTITALEEDVALFDSTDESEMSSNEEGYGDTGNWTSFAKINTEGLEDLQNYLIGSYKNGNTAIGEAPDDLAKPNQMTRDGHDELDTEFEEVLECYKNA